MQPNRIRATGGQRLNHELVPIAIEPRDHAHHDRDVASPANDVTERDRYVPRREPTGGDLVAQGLEQKVVMPVHERHLDAGASELLDGLQAAETAAHDDDIPLYARTAHVPHRSGLRVLEERRERLVPGRQRARVDLKDAVRGPVVLKDGG